MEAHTHSHEQSHDHGREHTHDHAHDHSHGENNYYIDQLCMVLFSAAFGAICLALYYLKTDMLTRLLGQQFHLFVLISGWSLVLLALARAGSLWVQVGRGARAHHDHDHGHDHNHEHGDQCHSHGSCEHTVGHAHGHHHHDHDAADHDHDWSPWRYVVLLVPVVLFLLGLPSKGPQAIAKDAAFTEAEQRREATEAVGLVSPSSPGWTQLVYAGYLSKDEAQGEVTDWDFKNLNAAVRAAALSPDDEVRKQWADKTVRVIGMYSPARQSDREFRLVKFKLTCCVADAVQLELPFVSRESITSIQPNSWVRVTGRVEFRKHLDEWVPVVLTNRQGVQKSQEDLNPYAN